MRKEPWLTEEQEALRLAGLRILARLIVRAHLASLVREGAAGWEDYERKDGSGDSPVADGGLPWTEDGHGR